jgi:hypothetical protein
MQSINSFPFKDVGKNPALRWPQGRNLELSTQKQNAWESVEVRRPLGFRPLT